MNKNMILVGAVCLVAIASFFYLQNEKSAPEKTPAPVVSTSPETTTSTTEPVTPASAETQTSPAPEKEVTYELDGKTFTRKLLQTTPEGLFEVQDFYPNGNKFTSPFLVKSFNNYKFGSPALEVAGDTVLEVWYENGAPYLKGTIKDGKSEGLWQYWHENGLLAEEGNYVAGDKTGTWSFFDVNGNLQDQVKYEEPKK